MTDQELFLKLYERHWTQGDFGLNSAVTAFEAYLTAKAANEPKQTIVWNNPDFHHPGLITPMSPPATRGECHEPPPLQ